MNPMLKWRAEVECGRDYHWVTHPSFLSATSGLKVRRIELHRDNPVARVVCDGTAYFNHVEYRVSRADGDRGWQLTYRQHERFYPQLGVRVAYAQFIGFKVNESLGGLYLDLETLDIQFQGFGSSPEQWRLERR